MASTLITGGRGSTVNQPLVCSGKPRMTRGIQFGSSILGLGIDHIPNPRGLHGSRIFGHTEIEEILSNFIDGFLITIEKIRTGYRISAIITGFPGR